MSQQKPIRAPRSCTMVWASITVVSTPAANPSPSLVSAHLHFTHLNNHKYLHINILHPHVRSPLPWHTSCVYLPTHEDSHAPAHQALHPPLRRALRRDPCPSGRRCPRRHAGGPAHRRGHARARPPHIPGGGSQCGWPDRTRRAGAGARQGDGGGVCGPRLGRQHLLEPR